MSPPKDPIKYKIWQQKQSESHKGQIAWNKNKYGYKCTIETRKKMSESHIGFKHSKKSCKIMQIKATGRKHTEETRQKLRKINIGNKHTDITLIKMSNSHKGINNPSYIHGESKRKYCYKFLGKNGVRERSLAFFNYRCIECGKTNEQNNLQHGHNLHVHHVYYRKMSCCDNEEEYESGIRKIDNKLYIIDHNNEINDHEIIGKPEKFAVLCSSCHGKTTSWNRYFWIQYYENKINKLYNGKSYYTKEEYEKL